MSFSAINTARAAVSNFVSLSGGHTLQEGAAIMSKFMKGVFSLRPALPKYQHTWDARKVLQFMDKQGPPDKLTLLELSQRLATLLLLLSGQCGQAIHSLQIHDIECSDSLLILRFSKPLKTTRPGSHTGEISLPRFPDKPNNCVVTTFKAYVKRTMGLRRGKDQLFLSSIKPHGPASRDSVSCWVKDILAVAGIDLAIFACHSTRSAASSLALTKGVSLETIMCTAGWERADTFRKFFLKPVTRDPAFALAVLDTDASCEGN